MFLHLYHLWSDVYHLCTSAWLFNNLYTIIHKSCNWNWPTIDTCPLKLLNMNMIKHIRHNSNCWITSIWRVQNNTVYFYGRILMSVAVQRMKAMAGFFCGPVPAIKCVPNFIRFLHKCTYSLSGKSYKNKIIYIFNHMANSVYFIFFFICDLSIRRWSFLWQHTGCSKTKPNSALTFATVSKNINVICFTHGAHNI